MFNQFFEKLVEEVAKVSKLTTGDVWKCMERVDPHIQQKESDITLFLAKISNNTGVNVADVYDALRAANISFIENVTRSELCVMFDINKKEIMRDVLKHIQKNKATFGNNDVGRGMNAVIDYSSPNIAKEFHMGHLRTTMLGNFVVKLLRASGYSTVGINFLGDWGKQFGLVLHGYERYGDEELLRKDMLKHLFDVYVKINSDAQKGEDVDSEAKRIFRKMELEGDNRYIKLWKKFKALSIEKYEKLYKRMGIVFDVYSGESLYNERGKEITQDSSLVKTKDDGSKTIDLGDLGEVVVMKSDGTTLYITRDIAAAIDRIKTYSPAKIIYVVGNEQEDHFRQLFRIMELMGFDKKIFEHVGYGEVAGMSTREGNVWFFEDVLDQVKDTMRKKILSNQAKKFTAEELDETSENLAMSKLLVMDFSSKRVKGYKFDIEQRTKNVSGTGPYFQYAHCRLMSIEDRNRDIDYGDIDALDLTSVEIQKVLQLVYKLIWFEHVVEKCLTDYEPSRIVTYLQDLCSRINAIINSLKVIGADIDVAKARLLILSSARIVLHNGLKILGIVPLNKM